MKFLSFPISDREVPDSESKPANILERLDKDLSAGKNIVLHCRQGIGRTGRVAACLLLMTGWEPETALLMLSTARGLPVPETAEQRRWIYRFATTLAGAR